MAGVLEWLSFALSGGALVVALLIATLARRSVGAVALAIYFGALALGDLLSGAVTALGGDPALRLRIYWTWTLCIGGAAMLGFAVVYPNLHLGRGRQMVLGGILLGALAGTLLIWTSPDAWWHEQSTGMVPAITILGPLFGVLALTIPMALLGHRWLVRGPNDYRKQIAWSIIPIAWWTLHDSLGYFVYGWILEGTWPWTWNDPLRETLAWLNIAGLAIALALMTMALVRTFRGRGASDDRMLGFVLLYMLPLTLVQVVLPWHHFLDVAIIPVAAYGVLRHRVVDIDLKIKHGLKRSTVAGAFIAVFFASSAIAQEFLAESFGWLLGGLAAGLLVFALVPIQRFAERFSTVALPHARDDAGYLAYRRYQIYKAALEGTVHDAVLDPSEASALRRLRNELGLTMEDHRLLESEIRRVVSQPAP